MKYKVKIAYNRCEQYHEIFVEKIPKTKLGISLGIIYYDFTTQTYTIDMDIARDKRESYFFFAKFKDARKFAIEKANEFIEYDFCEEDFEDDTDDLKAKNQYKVKIIKHPYHHKEYSVNVINVLDDEVIGEIGTITYSSWTHEYFVRIKISEHEKIECSHTTRIKDAKKYATEKANQFIKKELKNV
jgi:hypothetical protein